MHDILTETSDLQTQQAGEVGADLTDYDIPAAAITAPEAEVASPGDDAADEVAIAAPEGWSDDEAAQGAAPDETPRRVGALAARHAAGDRRGDADADAEEAPEESELAGADIPAADQERADQPDDADTEDDDETKAYSDVAVRKSSPEFKHSAANQSESRSVSLRRAGRENTAPEKPRSSTAATIQAMDKRLRTMGSSMVEVASRLGPEYSQNYHLLANPSLSNRDVAKMTQFTKWQIGSMRRRIMGSVMFNSTGEHHKTYTHDVRYRDPRTL